MASKIHILLTYISDHANDQWNWVTTPCNHIKYGNHTQSFLCSNMVTTFNLFCYLMYTIRQIKYIFSYYKLFKFGIFSSVSIWGLRIIKWNNMFLCIIYRYFKGNNTKLYKNAGDNNRNIISSNLRPLNISTTKAIHKISI